MPSFNGYNEQLKLLDEILLRTKEQDLDIGYLRLRYKILQAQREYSDFPSFTPAEAAKLPPIKPIPGKRVKTIEVNCPSCLVQPGEPCVMMTTRGKYAHPTGEPKEGYHITRTKKAKEVNNAR